MSLNAVIELILARLGLNNEEDRRKFLNPDYNDLADPFLMADLERACIRIFNAIESNERICIYADYDCDGVPSASMLYKFFELLKYENVFVYIPDRHDEGYGLHKDALEKIVSDGANLIITTDVGIGAIQEVLDFAIRGIDIIITDHHLPKLNEDGSDNLPKAFAVVNPKRSDCNYPFKDFCGAGVAFILVRGFLIKYGEYFKVLKGSEKWFLDLVGIATISDMVPLVGENRILSYWGLHVLRKSRNVGLRVLFQKNGILLKNITEDDIAFTLAPRINAASRMAHPIVAFNTLVSHNEQEALKNVLELESLNKERKTLTATIMRKANKIAENQKDNKIIVVGETGWHVGVLGIIAMKISEQYKKSVFVWARDNQGNIKGSARSIGDIHLAQFFSEFPENTFSAHGGHIKAGGFTVLPEAIYTLEQISQTIYETHIPKEEIEQQDSLVIDTSLISITPNLFNGLKSLAPFGLANPKPIFRIAGALVSGVKIFGKNKEHVEITINDSGKQMSVISFFSAVEPWVSKIYNKNITLTATLDESNFGGRLLRRMRLISIEI